MFTFLRKNRKSLVESNSANKYVLYALGEIALVVVGILIALQINNWNEQRKTRAKERHALQEVISDLDVNIAALKNILYNDENSIARGMRSLRLVITLLEERVPASDSLGHYFRDIHHYPDLDFKLSGYQSLLSMGIDIVSDHEIRSEIGRFFSFTLSGVDKAYREVRDDFYDYMLDYMRTLFIVQLKNNSVSELTPIDFRDLRDNQEYVQSLKTYLSVYEYYREKVQGALIEAEKLQVKISNTL